MSKNSEIFLGKTCLSGQSKKTKIGFQDRLSISADQKYCRILQVRASLSYNLFLCGRLRQVLLYLDWWELLIFSGPYSNHETPRYEEDKLSKAINIKIK